MVEIATIFYSASAMLRFQGREEAFHRRVVPTFTAPAHAARDVVTLEQLLGFVACVLGGFNRSSQHFKSWRCLWDDPRDGRRS